MVEEIIENVSQSYGLRYFLAFFTCFMYWVLHKVSNGWDSEYTENDALVTGIIGLFHPVTLPLIMVFLVWEITKKVLPWDRNIAEK